MYASNINMCDGKACDTCAKNGCDTLPSKTTTSGMFSFSGKDTPNTETMKSGIDKNFATSAEPIPIVPSPAPGDVPQNIATFVMPQDKYLVWLATLMYKPLPIEIPGATLNTSLTTNRIGVWTNATTAYVAFRGTAVFASEGIQDLLDDLNIANGANCDISLVSEGSQIITDLHNTGYNDIQLAGHSLGGRGALCCGGLPGVTKVVVINAAAPFLNLELIGPGEEKATHYHIFGDLISSHLIGARHIRVRVGYEQVQKVNWLNPYYHDKARFLTTDYWTYSTPQEEQDSLEYYFLDYQLAPLELISLLTSTAGLPFVVLVKTRICRNPIPGAKKSSYCIANESNVEKTIVDLIIKFLAYVAGGIVGFYAGGPTSIDTGGRAGIEASRGNFGPLITLVFPELLELSAPAQKLLREILEFLFKSKQPKSNPEEIKVDILDIIGPRLPQIGGPKEIFISNNNSTLENRIYYYLSTPKYYNGNGLEKTLVKIPEFTLDNRIDTELEADNETLPQIKVKNV